MGNPPDQQRIRSLIREGLRQLRAGKVSAAITRWEEVLTLDEGHDAARSYIDYIKKNRIRIAVQLGRTPPVANEPIQIPDGWPEPPAGLCDVLGEDEEEPEAGASDSDAGATPVQPRPAAKSSGHLPYAEVELTGASRPRLSDVLAKGRKKPPPSPSSTKSAPPAPRPLAPETQSTEEPQRSTPTRSPTGDDYLTMEIVVEDDDAPADPRVLPPPPGALAAPEMIIEAPKQESERDEPQDYLYDRASSEQLESLSLERLAGTSDSNPSLPPPPPPSGKSPAAVDPRDAADDAPTQARPHSPSSPNISIGEPGEPLGEKPKADLSLTPRVATTFDEVATNPRSDAEALSQNKPGGVAEPSPYTTLAGLGPRVLFSDTGDGDQQGVEPGLDLAPPVGADPLPGSPTSQPPDDFKRERGSFSEDAPTRALDTKAAPRGLHMEEPQEFDRQEGSFEDDIPTQARLASSSPSNPPESPDGAQGDFAREQGSFSDDLPTRARPSTVETGSGVIAEPRDFTREGSFSDDIPTTARPMPGRGESTFRSMPVTDFSREGSFSDDQATLERSGQRKEERLTEELEALLHPERGLALAKQLFDAGENERSLELAEQLLERYPHLTGLAELLEANRGKLEASLLAKLGDLESIPVPKTENLGRDNQDLDPRAAFLFSRIDGTMTLQDIIDISGMTQFESARLLLRLREIGLLDFEPPR